MQFALFGPIGHCAGRAEVGGALILKHRKVKGDGVLHPCYLLNTGVTSSGSAGNLNYPARLRSRAHYVIDVWENGRLV